MKLSLLPLILPLLSAPITSASPVPVSVPEKLEKRETALNAFLAILLDFLPPLNGTIESLSGVVTAFDDLVAFLTGEQTTYNELGGPCQEYTVIFARGTSEPGNVGVLVGPPFFDALSSVVGSGNLVIQGVNNYSASIDGYLEGGDPVGSAEMATQIEAAYAQCPNTKLVVSGYSQGGQLVHNAIGMLSAPVAEWIAKVVIFGDPYDGQTIPNVATSNIDVYCHTGDDICLNGDLILPAHLTYAENVAAAAAFVAS